MKEVDYIIVGLGIAGLTICERLAQNGKHFLVFNTGDNPATVVSGGVLNPVVLKRFTPAWNANQYCETALQFYQSLSKKLDEQLVEELPVWRVFNSVEEQNDWMVASDKIGLSTFLSSEVIENTNTAINATFGFGKVNGSGRIFPQRLLQKYAEFLQKDNRLISEEFEFDQLSEEKKGVRYKNISAKKVIFSEGAQVINNPFFRKELLIGNKGEYIFIKAPELKLEVLLKGSMFIIPLGNDIYKVGATYSRDDYTHHSTKNAREQIAAKVTKMINCDFDVVDQIAGVRPTVKDRRPLMGVLPESENKVFFNGLGTRGLMMAPTLSKTLYEFLEEGQSLPSEIDIKRFA